MVAKQSQFVSRVREMLRCRYRANVIKRGQPGWQYENVVLVSQTIELPRFPFPVDFPEPGQ